MREDYIHFAVRNFLKMNGWRLVAGEYPNGSDDELHSLKIMDRYLAKDDSPDHRRHSLNKLVPDLVAYKENEFLIIEMKPKFSIPDKLKLDIMLTERRAEFTHYLEEFLARYPIVPVETVHSSNFSPCLGFEASSKFERARDFVYLFVTSPTVVSMERG